MKIPASPILPAAFLACFLASFLAGPLAATTVVGTGSPASCTEAALAAAIGEANGSSGLVTFDCGAAPHTIVLTSEKALGQGVAIDGGDRNRIRLSGNDATRIFSLFQGAAVSIANITLADGFSSAGGGCILAFSSAGNESRLELANVRFEDCLATQFGGAIAATQAFLTLADCHLAGNIANTGGGGAISLNGGSLGAERTTFLANRAFTQGGAVQAWFAQVTIAGSSFVFNDADDDTGADAGGAGLVLRGSSATFSDTVLAGAALDVHNTLFQSPRWPAFACAPGGGTTSFTASVWDDLTCPEGGAGSRANTVIPLRPFGFSCGGAATERTRTVPLAPASPSLYAGNCRVGDPAIDQRGMPRPAGGGCDVGAAEFYVPCDGPFFSDGFETGNTQRWSQTLP